MTPNPCHRLPICAVLAVQLALAPKVGADTQASITGTPTAKGVVTCTLTTDHDPPPRWVHVWLSGNGKDYDLVQDLSGLFSVGPQADTVTATIVPLVITSFDYLPKGFLFPASGEYRLRFEFQCKDGHAPVREEVVVVVAPQKEADRAFLEQCGSIAFWESLGAGDPLLGFGPEKREELHREGDTAVEEFRALLLIKELLRQANLDIEVNLLTHMPKAEPSKWASLLGELTRSHSDADYAPYTAFVAARWHMTMISRGPDAILDPAYGRAMELLDMAIEKGDLFIVPRARLLQAILHWQVGKTPEARDALTKAIEAVGDTDSKLLARMQASVGKF